MEFRGALSWRVFCGADGQYFMYFDPSKEAPAVRDLTQAETLRYLDGVLSVSAVDRD